MTTTTNCYQAKAGQLAPQWYVIDATDQVVGRLAAQIAPILMGKHRPTYTPHIDTGDYVIVTNVEKVVFTGQKWRQKTYQRYSGYPGGQKEEAAWKLHQRHPERILFEAIRRMMPKNKIGRHMLAKLKLVVGPTHEHQAQQPIPLAPKTGRPASSGALFAPEPQPRAPKPRKARDKDTARPAATAPEASPALAATETTTPPAPPEARTGSPTAVAETTLPEPQAAAPVPSPAEPTAEAGSPPTPPADEPPAQQV